jgi:hypothetical protein
MRARQGIEGGKFCRWRHQLPGMVGRPGCEELVFYWVFRDGTGFAESCGE